MGNSNWITSCYYWINYIIDILKNAKKDIDTTKKELDSLKDVINIHTKIISSQDTKTITNIQINSSDMDVTRVAALFAQMPNGGK